MQDRAQNLEEQLCKGGRKELHRSVTTRDLKKERPVFRCSVSTFLQLVVACYRRSDSGVRREVKEREKIRREMERGRSGRRGGSAPSL